MNLRPAAPTGAPQPARSRRLRPAVLLGVASALALAGCGGTSGSSDSASATTGASASVSGTVTVSAAASLTGTYTELAESFEMAHRGVSVTLNFGGSDDLAQQIVNGAPVDVFAAANQKTMNAVTAKDTGAEPTVYATNTLVIVTPKDNPGKVTGLKDFADKSKKIALCADSVPCGAASTKVFEAAGITAAPDTLEKDVKAALTKVRLDEVDAALVYKTDAISAGDAVKTIEFPEATKAVNQYPIVVLPKAPNPEAAKAFTDYILSSEAQEVIAQAGFGKP